MAKKDEMAFVDDLKKQEKRRIRIPKKNDKDNGFVPVSINGYIYQIKAWELETLVETVMENFEELWSECAQQCTSFVTANGTVKLANSAVQEIQDKEHC